jgi:peptidoglycan pentaglycine glycine transferase (the first glycine)
MMLQDASCALLAPFSMRLIADPMTQDEWRREAARFDDVNMIQLWEYAEAKARTGRWTAERVVFEEDGAVVGMAQAVVRHLPVGRGGLVWVNRAPLHRAAGAPADALPRMLDAMRQHWVAGRKMYLRVAPTVTTGAGGFAPRGFRPTGMPGWAAGTVDLRPDEDALRAGLRQKWRNCLNKAERMGAEVREGSDGPLLESFLAAYAGTLAQADYRKSTTPELLAEMNRLLPPGERFHVLQAAVDGEPVAWVLVLRYGRRAEYIGAVTTSAGRRVNAGQLLLWRSLLAMKQAGATEFDVGGYDPDQRDDSGPGRFKHGLRPVPYRYADEIEAHAPGPAAFLIKRRIDRERRFTKSPERAPA